MFVFSIIWKKFTQSYTEMDLQPTIISIFNVLWFCCNLMQTFSLNLSFSLKYFMNMASGLIYEENVQKSSWKSLVCARFYDSNRYRGNIKVRTINAFYLIKTMFTIPVFILKRHCGQSFVKFRHLNYNNNFF